MKVILSKKEIIQMISAALPFTVTDVQLVEETIVESIRNAMVPYCDTVTPDTIFPHQKIAAIKRIRELYAELNPTSVASYSLATAKHAIENYPAFLKYCETNMRFPSQWNIDRFTS